MRGIILFAFMFPLVLFSQIGGRHVYDFINLTPQARLAAIGGTNVSLQDQDPNLGYMNPALVNDSMHNQLGLSWVNYLAGIDYGYVSYARSFENIADFHTGIQYVGYGDMIQADQLGNQTGTFSASDLAWVVGASRRVDNFRVGANLKLINSSIAGYNSFSAGVIDFGGAYQSDNQLFMAGMVFKNIGFQWSTYTPGGANEPIPLEIQAGVSYKLEHMPLRMNVTAHNIENIRLRYKDPDPEQEFDLSGEPIKQKTNTADDIFGHFIFGGEFLISRGFNVRFGYNHLRRVELRSSSKAGLAGFSFGAGLRIKQFFLDYAYANYHAIGGTHSLSLTTDLAAFGLK